MHVFFSKINPNEYKLQVKRSDNSEDEVVLNYREFLKHDLVHFVVEKNAGVSYGFYGSIANGKAMIELSPAYLKEQGMDLDPQLMSIEMMVGPLQGALVKGEIPITVLQDVYILQEKPVPAFLTQSFVNSVLREVAVLVKRYEQLPVGETLTLEFFKNDPAKSYCSEPATMAGVFEQLNKLKK